MSRASTITQLPLDRFFYYMGVNPVHANGIEIQANNIAPATTCGQPLMQYPWQSVGAVSREDVAIAIATAEQRISQYTRFKLLPDFEADERHPWPRPYPPELFAGSMMNMRNHPSAIVTNWTHLISGGIQALTLIGNSVGITYTDTDGDGYKESAQVSAALPANVTDPDEIRLFYPGENGDAAWEIRPIVVTITGGTVVVQFKREQAVTPGNMEALTAKRAVDGMDDSKFLTTADIYRLYNDPQQQVQFLWENQPAMCGCSTDGCQVCYMGSQFGCASARDHRRGLLSAVPATWDASAGAFVNAVAAVGRAPDRVRLWYRAGYRWLNNLRPTAVMDPRWERAVAYFAASLLGKPMCECQNVTAQVEYWQTDTALIKVSGSSSENFRISPKILDNPFGTTRGAIFAWNTFRQEAIGEAVVV